MKNGTVIAIDTSNYTTSVSLMRTDGELLANIKRPLPVKAGERGLRQSDAVFAHVKNLPDAMNEAKEMLKGEVPVAVGVSEKPRNVSGSYMPCFLSGVAVAEGIASALGIPLFRFSHQCGHVMAAVYSSGNFSLLDSPFAAYHVSGGTTELLSVKFDGVGFSSEIVGGTLDINAGQLIDRIGVHMGLAFPAGPYIEKLAASYFGKVSSCGIKPKGCFVNLSGVENKAIELFEKTGDKAEVSAFVLRVVGDALVKTGLELVSQKGNIPFVFAGGVMSNSLLKERIRGELNACFAEPAMSADNAVGIAALTVNALKR